MKVLRFEFQPIVNNDHDVDLAWVHNPLLSWVQETISNFKLKNLQVFIIGSLDLNLDKSAFKKLLETIAENMPKLQLLCLTVEVEDTNEFGEWDEYDKICQAFASGKNIKLEIRGIPVLRPILCVSEDVKIYSPK